jgi:hypothetical protein
MPLQNRVTPFGEFIATSARGILMGNRGGRLHDAQRKLGARRWASKQWICCWLEFKGRHRDVWGDSYTELFFLDEVTAFAVGHRPCFECRREEAARFAKLFSGTDPNSARSHASGNPESQSQRYEILALGPRFRGHEWIAGKRAIAAAMDKLLHAERLDGKGKRLHRRLIDGLPDGAMIAREGEAYAVRGNRLLPWTPAGYGAAVPRPRGMAVDVLTPPSILAVLSAGYRPLWHASADAAGRRNFALD